MDPLGTQYCGGNHFPTKNETLYVYGNPLVIKFWLQGE